VFIRELIMNKKDKINL